MVDRVCAMEFDIGNSEARCRVAGTGSVAGSCLSFLDVVGVAVPALLNRFASLRKGDIDRDRADEPTRPFEESAGDGVEVVWPFFFFDFDVPNEVVDPTSLAVVSVSRPSSILRTLSISESVRIIRSRNVFHLCVDSACRRRHSPFFVTRSCTPLSMIDSTFVVAGT